MTLLVKCIYLATTVAFLVTWMPILQAFARNEQRRLAYLVPIVLYLFINALIGLDNIYDPIGHPDPNDLWSRGHSLHASRFNFPLGYGLPIGVGVVMWDVVKNWGAKRKQPLSGTELEERIVSELAQQTKKSNGKDRW